METRRAEGATYTSQNGDSGAPVITADLNDNFILLGVNGGEIEIEGECASVFTQVNGIQQVMNFSLTSGE